MSDPIPPYFELPPPNAWIHQTSKGVLQDGTAESFPNKSRVILRTITLQSLALKAVISRPLHAFHEADQIVVQ